jgi:hypothetical protein
MERDGQKNKLESPTGGPRQQNTQVVDEVRPARSGLKNAGFMRFVHTFNGNDVYRSPTTSSEDCRPQAQKIIINKGIAGKIKE